MASKDFDVAIIGGGIVGCAVNFELTRHGYKCVLMERNSDIMSEASSGNSGMIHTGFDAPVDSLELECIKATQKSIYEVLHKFNTPFEKCGSILVAWTPEDEKRLPLIKIKASQIGFDLDIMPSEDLHRREPHLKISPHGAIHVPGEGIVDSNLLGISYAHHAFRQGSKILTNCEVTGFHDHVLRTSRGVITAHTVINCAGLYGDIVDDFAGLHTFSIKPRKGQYSVFKKSLRPLVNSIIFPVPTPKSKGVAVFKTVYNNIVCGPTAQDVSERTRSPFDIKVHQTLSQYAISLVPEMCSSDVIGHYTGVRPATEFKDYQIKAYPSQGWITVAGIRSTGVSASLGIAQLVKSKLVEEMGLEATQGSTATVDEIKWKFIKDSCSFSMNGSLYRAHHPVAKLGFQVPESNL